MANEAHSSSMPFALLEHSDQDGYYWRTSQRSLVEDEGWELYSASWPKQGMMLDGKCYPLPMSEQDTSGGESSSDAFFPTPSAQEPGWRNIEVVDKDGNPPQHPNQRFYDKKTGRLVQKGLSQIAQMWPPPPARDYRSGRGRKQRDRGRKQGPSLSEEAYRRETFPTPSAMQGHHAGTILEWGGSGNPYRKGKPREGQLTGMLNPPWVEWLMGFPLGWTDLEESETPSSPSVSKNSVDNGDG